jgi:hypothetical protein
MAELLSLTIFKATLPRGFLPNYILGKQEEEIKRGAYRNREAYFTILLQLGAWGSC